MSNTFIFKSNGYYLGFVQNNNIFSRDGIYLGWLEGDFAWDSSGQFRGNLKEIHGNRYIILNQLQIPPLPRLPKPSPLPTMPPSPPGNISPILLSVGYIDGFR